MPEQNTPNAPDGATQLYYVLDARSVVGNCCSWWRPEGKGYACSLDDAGLYTAEQAAGMRETDVAVPREVAERLAIRHVRIEHLHDDPIVGTAVDAGRRAARS